jgi:hypothetical protein
MTECRCYAPPFDYRDFTSREIGVDHGAEVSVVTCNSCGTRWLHYFFENESFTASGRWYRGLLAAPEQSMVTPATAIAYLGSLPWHFAGGSFYDSTGFRRSGEIRL